MLPQQQQQQRQIHEKCLGITVLFVVISVLEKIQTLQKG